MEKAPKQKRSDEVANYLRRKIYEGELPAGKHLIEVEIAEELGISRGPVREALKTLEYEGLVNAEANKGCMVARLSGRDAYEIFYLRGMLEKVALEQCGGVIPDDGLFSMMNIVEDMKRLEEDGASMQILVECDERFHKEIVKAGRMDRLLKLWQYLSPLNGAMFLKVRQYHNAMQNEAPPEQRKRKKKVWEMHQPILEVLKQGNLSESLRILDSHYLNTGEQLSRWEKRIEEINA